MTVNTSSSILGTLNNEKIDQAFSLDLATKYKKVEKKASEAIGSFASLVDELIKLKELSSGTQAKEKITRLAGELNNSSVFFAKMITEELGKIHEVVTPKVTEVEETAA